jgi:hypothetical protein
MPEGTDMVSVLITDHQEMKQYFRELEAATDGKARRDAADKLTAEVARHSVAEEMYVYPAARKILANGDELIDEEIKEHAEVEELLKTWEGMDGDDPQFMPVYEQIRDGLLHHIDEEEEPKLFPELQSALTKRSSRTSAPRSPRRRSWRRPGRTRWPPTGPPETRSSARRPA